jgi:hypothetical protein
MSPELSDAMAVSRLPRDIPLADFEPSAIGDAENVADHVCCRVYRAGPDIDILGDSSHERDRYPLNREGERRRM